MRPPARRAERRLPRYLALALGMVLGLSFVVAGLPLATGRSVPLIIPGLRGRASTLDPATLAEVARVAGFEFVAGGVLILALAALLFVRHVRPARATLAVVGSTFLLVRAIAWHASWLADRLVAG